MKRFEIEGIALETADDNWRARTMIAVLDAKAGGKPLTITLRRDDLVNVDDNELLAHHTQALSQQVPTTKIGTQTTIDFGGKTSPLVELESTLPDGMKMRTLMTVRVDGADGWLLTLQGRVEDLTPERRNELQAVAKSFKPGALPTK